MSDNVSIINNALLECFDFDRVIVKLKRHKLLSVYAFPAEVI